jgi:hypothetical protein
VALLPDFWQATLVLLFQTIMGVYIFVWERELAQIPRLTTWWVSTLTFFCNDL